MDKIYQCYPAHSMGGGTPNPCDASVPALAQTKQSPRLNPSHAYMPMKILFIDDNPDARDLIALLLRRVGYEAIPSSDGESGLEAAHREKPDLILLDIVLPDTDGYQVLEALRASTETRGIPVILISGIAQSREKAKALRAGAESYLERPFHPQELLDQIKDVLGEDQ